MQKTKEKCCADCKHCIRHDISDYECDKTGKRNRVTGRYEYRKCTYVIDTLECEFEQTKLQNAICEESLKKENEQKVKDDAEKYSYSKAVSNHIKYISRDSDVVRKIRNLVKLAYIHGAEKFLKEDK